MNLTVSLDQTDISVKQLVDRAIEDNSDVIICRDGWTVARLHPEPDFLSSKILDISSASESELLRQINIGPSDEEWDHYGKLVRKHKSRRLTDSERRQMLRFSEALEHLAARRLEALIELAGRRGIRLEDLMNQLGIRPRTVT